jgi:hypothetical protein
MTPSFDLRHRFLLKGQLRVLASLERYRSQHAFYFNPEKPIDNNFGANLGVNGPQEEK